MRPRFAIFLIALLGLGARATVAYSDGSAVDFSQIDRLLVQLPRNPATIEELADSVKAVSTSDLARARLLYKWITTNIKYDVETLDAYENGSKGLLAENRSWDQIAADILKQKKGVCGDMSYVYYATAKRVGLECFSVFGWLYPRDGDLPSESWQMGVPNHRWNSVKIDGQWQLLDCAAGVFMCSPESMIHDHYPLVPYWQLLDQKRTKRVPSAPPLEYPYAKESGIRFLTPVKCLDFVPKAPYKFTVENPSGTTLYAVVVKGWDNTNPLYGTVENKDGKSYFTFNFSACDEKEYYAYVICTAEGKPLYCFFIVLAA